MQQSPFAIMTVAAASLDERQSIVDRLVANAKANRTAANSAHVVVAVLLEVRCDTPEPATRRGRSRSCGRRRARRFFMLPV